MKDTPERRAALRAEIRKTSRDEFILKEMKRMGIWPNDQDKPTVQEAIIKRRSELREEIRDLNKKNKRYENREAELNKYKKNRLKQSREKQKLNKQKRADDREAKKVARREALGEDINYLGKRFSAQLKEKQCDADLLAKNNLGHITDVATLSEALKISVYDLRFLSFSRKLSKHCHYTSFGIKKKNGDIRKISAPKPKLKSAQRAILDSILYKMQPSTHAHGFLNNKSIVTNAKPHVSASVVVNMDLKDFFPTLDYPRVFGFFKKVGFSPQLSTILALICTIPDHEQLKVHGEIRYLNQDSRRLPQGAATSPMLTNLICRRMDSRLAGIAKSLGFTFTRYADDLTFSGPTSCRKNINKLMWQVRSVIKDEDFKIHPDKTHVMVDGHRKEVTGIVVNDKLNISRKKLKAFKAVLFQIEKDGPNGKTWGDPQVDLFSSIEGFARYVHMVNPEKGKEFISRVAAITKKHNPRPKKNFRRPSGDSDKPWWKFW